jgi:hypothetical protein
MGFKIKWMSTSNWVGTRQCEHEGDETYETREEAEKALAEMQKDVALMKDVHYAAVEGQGVEGWLEIADEDD